MRTIFPVTLLLFAVLNPPSVTMAAKAQSASDGLSAAEFRAFAKSVPELPGRIQAVLLFRESGGKRAVALATLDERGGWRLFVFNSSSSSTFRLEWKSARLDDSFAVSSPSSLRLFSLGDEDAVQFSGCGRHACPDVFSFMLYVPSLRTAFTATSVYGKVTYSSNMRLPADEEYKGALDRLIGEHAQFIQKLAPRNP
jgi:hypothetical protein